MPELPTRVWSTHFIQVHPGQGISRNDKIAMVKRKSLTAAVSEISKCSSARWAHRKLRPLRRSVFHKLTTYPPLPVETHFQMNQDPATFGENDQRDPKTTWLQEPSAHPGIIAKSRQLIPVQLRRPSSCKVLFISNIPIIL